MSDSAAIKSLQCCGTNPSPLCSCFPLQTKTQEYKGQQVLGSGTVNKFCAGPKKSDFPFCGSDEIV